MTRFLIPVQSIPLRRFTMRFLHNDSICILRYPRPDSNLPSSDLPSCGEPDNQTPQDMQTHHCSARNHFRAGCAGSSTSLRGEVDPDRRGRAKRTGATGSGGSRDRGGPGPPRRPEGIFSGYRRIYGVSSPHRPGQRAACGVRKNAHARRCRPHLVRTPFFLGEK